MDPQSSTGRATVDFEESRPIGDHAQLSAYQRVSIEDVLNPRPANPNPIASSSALNNCFNDDIHMLPAYRQLSDVQEEMVWELGTLNLGPVKAFQIMRKRYGGFENVGATVDDCKNFRKRINSYIGEYDADMVINRMTDKKQYLADYSFKYSVDDDKRLTGLFWAHGLCKLNYMEFGDAISFDATFKTTRYKMVFVPFTGIDNHCRNVTLGAGLLASESIESYKWLLNSFLKSFGQQPKVVVTDQDPAMKQAIEEVANSQLTLIEFMNHFDGAMDVQRFNHRKNDHISRYIEPADWSETTLEKDAAKRFIRSIFFDKQIEIYGTISECLPMDTKIEGPQIRIMLKDFKAHGDGLLEIIILQYAILVCIMRF
ncbi:protein FAR1-RELATED SEQUENCE 5-like [Helianthus annuus]|uniref:protein FAR1-RELATED SEQUENCE 5-like n=1 Tax=Helianthus annuus TaxID=4232 RepID=UPI00165307CC|nr:protein FAR1-RELATED SEQUENCE 5-like [Helianthus annuus]